MQQRGCCMVARRETTSRLLFETSYTGCCSLNESHTSSVYSSTNHSTTVSWQLRIREERTSYGRNLAWRWTRGLTCRQNAGLRGQWLRLRVKRGRDTVTCWRQRMVREMCLELLSIWLGRTRALVRVDV